jgi:hypothetical protein
VAEDRLEVTVTARNLRTGATITNTYHQAEMALLHQEPVYEDGPLVSVKNMKALDVRLTLRALPDPEKEGFIATVLTSDPTREEPS